MEVVVQAVVVVVVAAADSAIVVGAGGSGVAAFHSTFCHCAPDAPTDCTDKIFLKRSVRSVCRRTTKTSITIPYNSLVGSRL